MLKKKSTDIMANAGELNIREYNYNMDQGFVNGAFAFDQHDFIKANIQFDSAWVQDCTANRLFYQALVLISTTFMKIQLQNTESCDRILEQAIEKLERYRPAHLSINVDQLLDGLQQWLDYLKDLSYHNHTAENLPEYPKLRITPE